MGKKIDVFVLSVVGAFGLYLFFCRVTGNHTAALLLSGIAFLLISRLLRKVYTRIQSSAFLQKRRLRRQAGSAVMHLACMDAELAGRQLSELMKKCYDCDAPLELIQAPPSSALSQDRVFDLWKAHRGENRLVICASCSADIACHSLCSSLKQPKIALLDSNVLSQLLAEHPEWYPKVQPEAPVQRKHRLKQVGALLIQRRNAPRCLLFSAVMLVMYLLGGRLGNLIACIALLFLALTALKRPSRPVKLF